MLKYTEQIYYTYTGTIQTSTNITETAGVRMRIAELIYASK